MSPVYADWKAMLTAAVKSIPSDVSYAEIVSVFREARKKKGSCCLCGHNKGIAMHKVIALLKRDYKETGMLKAKWRSIKMITCEYCQGLYNLEARCKEWEALAKAQEAKKDRDKRQAQEERKRQKFLDGTGTAASDYWYMKECITPGEIQELRDLPYRDFLQTKYWKVLRRYVLYKRDNACELCPATRNLQVHHRTYEHRGEEVRYLEDLIVLCRTCHTRHHDKIAS